VASEIGQSVKNCGRKRLKKRKWKENGTGWSEKKTIPYTEGSTKLRVNPYMKCGWKKAEPPAKEKESLRD